MELPALPVTLRPARRTLWKHLLAMSLIAGLGASSVYWGLVPVIGWGLLVFGGILTTIAFVQLLPGAASLTLDEDGFHVTGLFRRTSYRWDEIEEFGVYQADGKKQLVCFNFVEGARPRSFLRDLSRSKTGYEAGIGDLYGPDSESLAEMLNAYLDRQTSSED